MFSSILFVYFLLCLQSNVVLIMSSIYADQLGEFDWILKQIGLIEKSIIIQNKYFIVATSKSILASLDIQSGDIQWKLVLPKFTKIENLFEYNNQVISITSQNLSDDGKYESSLYSNMLVRSWSALDGTLLWDTSLGGSLTKFNNHVTIFDALYDTYENRLIVLYDNTLHFISPPLLRAISNPLQMSTSVQHWSWSATNDLGKQQTASSSNKKKKLILSSLVIPAAIDAKDQSQQHDTQYSRIAIGCFVSDDDDDQDSSNDSNNGLCNGDIIVVKVKINTNSKIAEFHLDTLSTIGKDINVLSKSLRGIMSPDANNIYNDKDIIFGTNQQNKMMILQIRKSSLHLISTLTDNYHSNGSLVDVSSFIYVYPSSSSSSSSSELVPAISVCDSAVAGGDLCKIWKAVLENGKWKLDAIETHLNDDCEDHYSSLTTNTAPSNSTSATSSILLQQSHPHFFHNLVNELHTVCIVRSISDDNIVTITDIAIKSSSLTVPSSTQVGCVHFNSLSLLIPPLKYDARHLAPIRHITVLPRCYITPSTSSEVVQTSAAASTQCHYRVLVVLHSGVTVMLSKPAAESFRCSDNNNGGDVGEALSLILWKRNEGLSMIQEAIVVDKPVSVTINAGLDDELTKKIPGLYQRLTLQHLKLKYYFSTWMKSFQTSFNKYFQSISAETSIGKSAHIFGFDKVAVCLCFNDKLARWLKSEKDVSKGIKLSEAGFQLIGLETTISGDKHHSHTDRIRWVTYLQLSSDTSTTTTIDDVTRSVSGATTTTTGEDEIISYVKIVESPVPVRSKVIHHSTHQTNHATTADDEVTATTAISSFISMSSITIIVSTVTGKTFVWEIDSNTGRSVLFSSSSSLLKDQNTCTTTTTTTTESYVSHAISINTSPIISVMSSGVHTNSHTLVLHHPSDDDEILMTDLMYISDASSSNIDNQQLAVDITINRYVHHINYGTGKITIYQVTKNGHNCEGISNNYINNRIQLSCLNGKATSSLVFDPSYETIVDVTYPNYKDVIHSKYSILGDDSILVKYLNPNIMLLITTPVKRNITNEESTDERDISYEEDFIFITLIDTITGKILVRLVQENAKGPVHSIIIENHLIVTYWNSKAKRSELSSIVLYDGVIDSYELSPFASSRARANSPHYSDLSNKVKTKSAYTAVSPISMQKTFVLPQFATALQQTITERGIANKNLLIGLCNGQIFSVDLKQIHPRRPFSEPSQAEKIEGLQKYSPFIIFNPQTAVTHNYSLPGGVDNIISVPSKLESSTLVLSFGGRSADIQFNRIMPSQEFDLLSSDFNYILLVLTLATLASGVYILRRMQNRKQLNTLWT